MAKFTLHNENGDFMYDTTRTFTVAKNKCNNVKYKCIVYETYFAPSPFNTKEITEHGKPVYRNF